MTEHEKDDQLDEETQALKDIAAQVEREREGGASRYAVLDDDAVPETVGDSESADAGDGPEDEADVDGSGTETVVPPARPGM